MAWLAQLQKTTHIWLQKSVKTFHGILVLIGLTIGLCYLPTWLGYLIPQALRGKVGGVLIACMLALAGFEVWQKRQHLRNLKASRESRAIGHLLIVAGVVFFPWCLFAMWPQSLVWLAILVGIALSTWGSAVFIRFPLPSFFIALTVYPRIGIISRFVWELLTPSGWLENTMAWITGLTLRWMGFPATQSGSLIEFPEGSVKVGWGCNGLDMAITIAAIGLFLGIVYKQKPLQTMVSMLVASILAMLFNIPRLMLVTVAYVYWGKGWFDFWHGFWGGQIFVGILLTIYYYALMAMIDHQKVQSRREKATKMMG
ncbi:cyanoexosortase C [Altericista sp. CCNU0014]|uniref:cyanoexosortase C n=1 Tax=Altericista sp. CCNU0014 TaxID=3082949 RepID=UPI0038501AFE